MCLPRGRSSGEGPEEAVPRLRRGALKNFERATGSRCSRAIVYLSPSCSRLSSPPPGSLPAVSTARVVRFLFEA